MQGFLQKSNVLFFIYARKQCLSCATFRCIVRFTVSMEFVPIAILKLFQSFDNTIFHRCRACIVQFAKSLCCFPSQILVDGNRTKAVSKLRLTLQRSTIVFVNFYDSRFYSFFRGQDTGATKDNNYSPIQGTWLKRSPASIDLNGSLFGGVLKRVN